MIVGRNDRAGVEKDGGLEHFADMNNADRKRADRDDVHTDDPMFRIETTDKELLAIETSKDLAAKLSKHCA